MSAITGLLVGVFVWITGLQFAIEWGVIAFAPNYIPFIGAFIATLFPTLLTMTIALAILRLCDQQASSRWLADLLGGPANTKTGKR
jgi:predicted PurR-regulated permease PerM